MYVNNNPSVGDTLQVRITAKQSYGVFVRMPNGRDGLIRLNDISWQNQAKILGQLSVGEVFYGESHKRTTRWETEPKQERITSQSKDFRSRNYNFWSC